MYCARYKKYVLTAQSSQQSKRKLVNDTGLDENTPIEEDRFRTGLYDVRLEKSVRIEKFVRFERFE
jgi:hypothetical protein